MSENKNIDTTGNEEVQNNEDSSKDIRINVEDSAVEQPSLPHSQNNYGNIEEEKCEKKNITEDVKNTLENTRIIIVSFYEKTLEKTYAIIKKVKEVCLKAYSFLMSKISKKQEETSNV
ncbi:uncharacterized protein VICG_01384 [Vittaforma corneae ATCC 50505]|uniref:Uncharacterized protein n=1 Tax=Vittaforma corneae (strain ATCC 50505) TaxID=993615 RepID=L2GLZ3_VITCO|nr:uncharacterized protein VICG_01384 [Vittaforma corneae ATCC 50505]ELA41520.1 hypothetical protein VICG_01384 [Vittaforma corneae ATCC 50505]